MVALNPLVNEAVRIAVSEPWRLEPHRLAVHASGGKWQAWPYLKLISSKIARAVGRGNGRIVISMPPRHGKSSIASFWTPIWFLNNFPAQRVLMTSHSAVLAAEWGRKVRNELENNPLLTTKLAPDSAAADKWATPEGGGMLSAGVGGGITGFGGDLILIDDPHPTWEKAMSATERNTVIEWFNGTLYDRREPNATIIVLAHRWHEDDLPGYLVEHHSDQWDYIVLPALAEANDPLGRAVGEALCPDRYPAEQLRATRAASAMVFDAKFQQKPPGVGTGTVYDRYDPARNQDKTLTLRSDLPLDVSIDFNRNPGMHIELGQYDPAADLFTVVHEVHGPLMKLDAALKVTAELIQKESPDRFRWPLLRIFGDATGTQERAETTATAYQQVKNWLASHGWPSRLFVPARNPPIVERVAAFNEALCDADGDVHYRFNPLNCPRLLADFKGLKADEHGLIDKRDAKLSHASDAEGYRVHKLRPVVKPPEMETVSVSDFRSI